MLFWANKNKFKKKLQLPLLKLYETYQHAIKLVEIKIRENANLEMSD